MRDQADAADNARPCDLCGKPGWAAHYDASQARRARITKWQRRLPGPAPVLTIRRCDSDSEDLGLYHLRAPYVIEHDPDVRLVRCVICELFAWRSPNEPDSCRSCRPRESAPAFWWEGLLSPHSGLIRQSRQLRAALCPPSIALPDVLRAAAGPVPEATRTFVQGVGHCLQMAAAVPADVAAIRAFTHARPDYGGSESSDMWRYAALLQGVAVGQLPLRQYWEVHALLVRVVVPATVSELLARVQVNATRPHLWRIIGAAL